MFIILSISQLWFVYLASTFIVFWERDITSEHHGTPVHISTSVYTLNLLPVLTFSCHYYLLRWSFVNIKDGGIDNSSVLVGSKFICFCVQVHVNSLARSNFWRRCHLLVSLGVLLVDNLGIFTEGNLLLRYISPSTWGNQREVREVSSPYQQGKQITSGQLTGLKTHRNANYATKERKRLKSMGSTPR